MGVSSRENTLPTLTAGRSWPVELSLPVVPDSRAAAPSGGGDPGDPPMWCLRWSAAERSRLVSPHTVNGVDAATAGSGGRPGQEDRPGHRGGGRGGSERWARGNRLARLAALGLLGVSTLTGCSMPNNEFWRFGWPDGITEAVESGDLWIGLVIAALVVGFFVWGLIFWCIIGTASAATSCPCRPGSTCRWRSSTRSPVPDHRDALLLHRHRADRVEERRQPDEASRSSPSSGTGSSTTPRPGADGSRSHPRHHSRSRCWCCRPTGRSGSR